MISLSRLCINRLLVHAPACGRRQMGVSLIEVLVAVVVLSIGLLGLAGLQASGMRVGQSSIYRSQASQLAYDLVDRMRVNFANAASYNLALGAAAPAGATVAALDLQDWKRRLLGLPAGDASVTVNGSQVTVLVQWDDSRGADVLRGGALQGQFQITAELAN